MRKNYERRLGNAAACRHAWASWGVRNKLSRVAHQCSSACLMSLTGRCLSSCWARPRICACDAGAALTAQLPVNAQCRYVST
jgi:hypothetical protein